MINALCGIVCMVYGVFVWYARGYGLCDAYGVLICVLCGMRDVCCVSICAVMLRLSCMYGMYGV